MGYSYSSTRSFFGGPVPKTVKLLIFINIAVYLLQVITQAMGSRIIDVYFGLIPYWVTHRLTFWQLATYMFLHGSPWHILFNMLALWMFGGDLERYWGTRRFIKYYFITGVGAGVCSWLVDMNGVTVTIGASGAIYGLLLAYGVLWPNRIVYFNFLFPIKIKWLVLIYGALAFISSISGTEPGIANVAHLGGMLIGLVYLKWKDWLVRYRSYTELKHRERLKKQFEVYYGEIRRKLEDEDKGRGPTIH